MVNDTTMPSDDGHEFYGRPENQIPQGPPRRRREPMTDPAPVRFPPDVLEQVKAAAAADDRSVSSWIRRAITRSLQADRT